MDEAQDSMQPNPTQPNNGEPMNFSFKTIGKEVVFMGGKDKPTFHAVMDKDGTVFKISARDYEKSKLKDMSTKQQIGKYHEYEIKRLVKGLSMADAVEFNPWAKGKSPEEKLKKLRTKYASASIG